MKVAKNTIIITFSVTILSFLGSTLLHHFSNCNFWENVCFAFFGSAIIALAQSAIIYCYDKRNIIKNCYKTLLQIFRDIAFLMQLKTQTFDKTQLGRLCDRIAILIKNIDSLSVEKDRFSSFCCKQNKAFNEITIELKELFTYLLNAETYINNFLAFNENDNKIEAELKEINIFIKNNHKSIFNKLNTLGKLLKREKLVLEGKINEA